MVQLLLDARALLGESPVWHAGEARLYWVDIDGRKIPRTDPATGADEVMELTAQVGCIAPRAQGGLIAALENGCEPIDAWRAAPARSRSAALAANSGQRGNAASVVALVTVAGPACGGEKVKAG